MYSTHELEAAKEMTWRIELIRRYITGLPLTKTDEKAARGYILAAENENRAR